MSGGSSETTMGVLVDVTGKVYSGSNSTYNSGFTGTYGTAGLIYTGVPFPDTKYYDKYAYVYMYNDPTAFDKSHLGDATGETRNWNGDVAFFPYHEAPWFDRGGTYGSKALSGLFCFASAYHDDLGLYTQSFRVVVSKK